MLVVGRGLAEQGAEVVEVVEEVVVEAEEVVEVEAEDPGWAVVAAYELVF